MSIFTSPPSCSSGPSRSAKKRAARIETAGGLVLDTPRERRRLLQLMHTRFQSTRGFWPHHAEARQKYGLSPELLDGGQSAEDRPLSLREVNVIYNRMEAAGQALDEERARTPREVDEMDLDDDDLDEEAGCWS